jgi:hypothetical protein
VSLCLIEVKFGLNHDIADVSGQLQGYYAALKPRVAGIAGEIEGIFRQKLELGLYRQPNDRVAALKTLHVSPILEQVQFVVLLVDYNENSTLFQKQVLQALPFAGQIRLLQTGFGMWQQNVKPLGGAIFD